MQVKMRRRKCTCLCYATLWVQGAALVTYAPDVQRIVNSCPRSAYLWHDVKETDPRMVAIVVQYHLWHGWHPNAGFGNPLELQTYTSSSVCV